jgi:hypothetical protein
MRTYDRAGDGLSDARPASVRPPAVARMVLIGASSEPEVAVYDRLHAGPWIDGTVQPAPNQWINTHATVRELERVPRLGRISIEVFRAQMAVKPGRPDRLPSWKTRTIAPNVACATASCARH